MIKRKIDDRSHCEIIINKKELRIDFYQGWWIFKGYIHTHKCLLPDTIDDETILYNIDYAIKNFKLLRGDALDGKQKC